MTGCSAVHPVWTYLDSDSFGLVWPRLSWFGLVWTHLDSLGLIRADFDSFELIWTHSHLFGSVWPLLGWSRFIWTPSAVLSTSQLSPNDTYREGPSREMANVRRAHRSKTWRLAIYVYNNLTDTSSKIKNRFVGWASIWLLRCFMLLNVTLCYVYVTVGLIWNHWGWFRLVGPDETEWVQMSPNQRKWVETSPNKSEWVRRSLNESKWVEINPSDAERVQMSPN